MAVKTYYLSKGDVQLSEHFRLSEFQCHDWSDRILLNTDLINVLEKLHAKMNAGAINITSGYRTPSHSVAVGGYSTDQHTQGNAADITVKKKDGTLYTSAQICCALEDLNHQGGIGRINTTESVHVDVRGYKCWFDEVRNETLVNSWYSYLGIKKPTTTTQATTSSTAKKNYGKGIDVSEFNGNIDWAKVKAGGIGFAIIRMGTITQNSGVSLDETWRRNVSECERVGLPYGAYVYTYVQTPARMKEVMPFVTDELKKTCKSMKAIPCYLDIEENAVVAKGNSNTLEMAKIFMASVEGAGFAAGIYSTPYWFNTYMSDKWFDTKAKWVADWSSKCDFTRGYGVWQYSSKGSVSGISGAVDMNYAYFDVTARGSSAKKALTNREQIYTVKTGDTWASIAEAYGLKAAHGGNAILAYNNYKTYGDSSKIVYNRVTQKTVKIPPVWLDGDVDGDGRVTTSDAAIALKVSAKIGSLNTWQTFKADINADGKVTAADARAIQKIAKGKK